MTISTHVLDVSAGRPAADVLVRLEVRQGRAWHELSAAATDADGRVATLFPRGAAPVAGVYRLTFAVGAYFSGRSVETFYENVVVEFKAADASAHYHVPLLVSPYGYSTYRGS